VWNVHKVHPDLYFCGGASIPGGYPPTQYVSQADRHALYNYIIVESAMR